MNAYREKKYTMTGERFTRYTDYFLTSNKIFNLLLSQTNKSRYHIKCVTCHSEYENKTLKNSTLHIDFIYMVFIGVDSC